MAFPGKVVLKSGTVLHERFVIEHTISSGGFGNVYLAVDHQEDGRQVAIKEAFFSDEKTRKQFAVECQVLIEFNHPYIVRGYLDFEEAGTFYLVMQYIDGLNLEELQIKQFESQGGPLPEERALALLAPVCAATTWLHERGVLHRDIKPANIKLTAAGEPILLDLGLAKFFQITDRTLTAAQAFTPGYAPPEQCDEDGTTTKFSDIYSLGATLYYALTGRQPDEAIKRLQGMTYKRIDPLLPPSARTNLPISAATDKLVMRALTLDPTKRYATTAELEQQIRASLAALTMICPTCGKTVRPDAFCGECGAALPQPAVARVAAAPAQTGERTVTKGQALTLLNKLNRPESMPTRRIVPIAPRRLKRAYVLLMMGLLALAPALGFLCLFILPAGLMGLRTVRRSHGMLRGGGMILIGMLLSVLGLAELVGIIYTLLPR